MQRGAQELAKEVSRTKGVAVAMEIAAQGLAEGIPERVVHCRYGLCHYGVLAHVQGVKASPGKVHGRVPHPLPVTLYVTYVLPG